MRGGGAEAVLQVCFECFEFEQLWLATRGFCAWQCAVCLCVWVKKEKRLGASQTQPEKSLWYLIQNCRITAQCPPPQIINTLYLWQFSIVINTIFKKYVLWRIKTKNKRWNQDRNTHSATKLIKSAIGDGATGLFQSQVSAQHCEHPRARN